MKKKINRKQKNISSLKRANFVRLRFGKCARKFHQADLKQYCQSNYESKTHVKIYSLTNEYYNEKETYSKCVALSATVQFNNEAAFRKRAKKKHPAILLP